MKFNINRPPKQLRKQRKINARREWHTKFSWLPTTVDETTTSYKRIWFENYWRRGHYGPSRMGRPNPLQFTKYSVKEYFKKRLNGDFNKNDGELMADTSGPHTSGKTLGGPSVESPK